MNDQVRADIGQVWENKRSGRMWRIRNIADGYAHMAAEYRQPGQRHRAKAKLDSKGRVQGYRLATDEPGSTR